MAGVGYSGYFLKGLASGLQSGLSMGQQVIEMKWQKAQRKKLEDKENQIKESMTAFGSLIKQCGADSVYSDDEIMQLNVALLSAVPEVKVVYADAINAIQTMNKNKLEEDLQWFDFTISQIDGLNPKDVATIFETAKSRATTEKGKNYFTAYENMYKKKYEALQAQPIAKVFPTAEAVQAKYPNAGYKYDSAAGGYVPTFQKPEATPTEIELIEKNKKILDFAYNTGNPERFNRVAKSLGIETTFETYKQKYEAPSGEISQATPAPTSTENIREDILNADTFADANRIYKNYADKYDETALGITDLKQEWASGQINYLNKVKKSIENLLVDRGDKGQWLNNKPVTQETVGLEFKGERPASEIYEMLYKSYIEYLEKLRKLGIDVSQFPELLPLGEIEKVGGTEGFFGWGIQKGDYKSIYK